jgi:hypothetical protein
MAAALRAEFREKSFVVLAHHLDDFIVGHGAIVSPPIPSAFAGVIRGTPVPSPGATPVKWALPFTIVNSTGHCGAGNVHRVFVVSDQRVFCLCAV